MKRVFITLLLCLSGMLSYGQTIQINDELISEYLDRIGKNNQDMGKIAIRKNGEVVYKAAFGPEGVMPYEKTDLKYRVGSISKMLTGILTFRLQEQGLLQLDETIQAYFPTIPNADKITISHLLSHTSGLKDFIMKDDTLHTWLFQPVSQAEIIKEIIRQRVQFEPGKDVRYSNAGYYLLTLILEKKSGLSYQQLLTKEILSPLGLTHTVASAPDGPDIALPYKYSYKDKKWVRTEDFYSPNITGVGDVASTPMDLTAIMDALFAGKLVNQVSLEQMKPEPFKQMFGKGLAFMPFYEKAHYGHSGGTFGSYAMVMHSDNESLSIAITINGQEKILNDLMIDVCSVVYGRDFVMPGFTEPTGESFSPDDLTLFEGIYGAANFPIKLKVFRQGDDLYFQGSGQPSFPVNRSGKNQFFKKDIKVEAEFMPEEGIMKFSQFGQNWELKKEE